MDNVLVSLKIFPETEFNRETKHHNLLKGLPYPTNTVGCIYAGELWEHFEYQDAFDLTKECCRVLQPGGVLRVCVPDGPAFWEKYLNIFQDQMAKPRSKRDPEPLRCHVEMFFNEICTRKKYLGSMGHTHKWNFDEIQLIDMFEKNGFIHVERMKYHDSRISDIKDVERSSFLIVEGVKR